MALKSQVFSTTVNHYTLELTVVEDSTNTTANTSAVSYTLKLKSGGYDFAQYGVGASVSLNGAQVAYRDRYSAPKLSIGTYSSITLLSGTTTIAHNSDGTKTIAVAATLNMAKAYYTPGPMSISGQNMTLTTIPRATAPVVSGAAIMGQAKTISLSPASSSFTHTLLYSFGSASGTIASGVKSSVSWTPPLSLASQVPDATSGTATITCHTYSGGTLIGTKTTTVTLQVPSSVVPTISGVTLSEATSGIAAQFGAYVQSKSALKVQISASSQYGAAIRSYSTTVLGTTYTGSTVTTSPLGQSGTVEVSIKVTDSRGRTATTTRNISVVAYSAPRITSFSADRVDSSGSADDEGTHLKVTLALAISPVGNKNTKQYKLLYKRKSDTSYTALQTTTPSDYSYSGTLTFTASSYPEFSSDYGYDIRLQVSDYFTSVNSDDELQTAAVWLDLNISGKGVGIGKVSEKDAMEVAMPVEFLESADFKGELLKNGEPMFPVDSLQSMTGATMRYQSSAALSVSEIDYIAGFKDSNTLAPIGGGNVRQFLKVPYCISDGNYYGLGLPDGITNAYLRAPESGFIPYQSGGNGNLGTSSWPWDAVYANNVCSSALNWRVLWNGSVGSGSIILPNARKNAAIIIMGKPGANESRVATCLPAGGISNLQITSNLAYMLLNITNSGTYDLSLNIDSNPSNGEINYVWGIVRYQA